MAWFWPFEHFGMLPGAFKGLKIQQNQQNKAQKEANLEVIIEEQARPVTLLAYPRPQLV